MGSNISHGNKAGGKSAIKSTIHSSSNTATSNTETSNSTSKAATDQRSDSASNKSAPRSNSASNSPLNKSAPNKSASKQYVTPGEPVLITGSEGSHLSKLFNAMTGERIDHAGYVDHLQGSKPQLDDVAVYVHLPFCASRCLSCDHVTTVTHDPRQIDHYIDDLGVELDSVSALLETKPRVSQLHLGGGTPNYLSEPQLLRLMNLLEDHFVIDERTDALIEASAKRSSLSQLRMLKGLGFSNMKLQVRDVDADVQRAVGRSDSLAVMTDVVDMARSAGIETLGMDLVYGLPNQSRDSIQQSLDQLLALDPDRLSCYAYQRKTAEFMHQRAIDAPSLPSLADKLIMFNDVVDRMEAAGYVWIGLDTFVRADDPLAIAQQERRLHHNWMGYNEHGTGNLLGFGASAISEIGGACVQNHCSVDDYHAAIESRGMAVKSGVLLDGKGQRKRASLNALLCNLELEDYAEVIPTEAKQDIQSLESQGVLRLEGDKAYVTPQGRFVLHHICGHNESDRAWASGW